MKIKDGFLVKKILDDYLVVPTGNNIVDFSVAVSLNESGAFLWEQLKSDMSAQDLAETLMAEYDIQDKSVAEQDVNEFIQLLRSNGFLEE